MMPKNSLRGVDAGVLATKVRRGLLEEFLGSLRATDAKLDALRQELTGTAGPLEATPDPEDPLLSEITRLLCERHSLLERMAQEALPPGRWVEHGRQILYLETSRNFVQAGSWHALHVLPSSDAGWVPEGVPELPEVTLRRAAYARAGNRERRHFAVVALVALATGFALEILPFDPGAWTALLFFAPLSIAYVFLPGARSFGRRAFFERSSRPHPFEEVSPGTGERSGRAAKAHEWRQAETLDGRIRLALARPADRPLEKSHDHSYTYEGFHPGCSSEVRVRIYQDPRSRKRSAGGSALSPVVVLSQRFPPQGTSLTNLIEAVAAEVVVADLPHLIPRGIVSDLRAVGSPPFRIVEHYWGDHPRYDPREGDESGEAFALVSFRGYRVKAPAGLPETETAGVAGEPATLVRSNATERPRFGTPEWHHGFGRRDVEKILGQPL